MSYRNKTYVVFDADEDRWAYAYMRGWKQNERVDFAFFDAHDLRPLSERASEATVRGRLRERMVNAKQVLVLVGEKTRNLYRFVRWEIELAVSQDLPIIVANLSGERSLDSARCPPILRDHYAVHVPFKIAIIKYALDNFPREHASRDSLASGPRHYANSVYAGLGL